MANFTNYEPHTDARKSFYGKAQELEKENGERWLFSYWTPILKITADDRLLYTKWATYSRTTARHVMDFIKHYKKFYLDKNYKTADFLKINGELVENL